MVEEGGGRREPWGMALVIRRDGDIVHKHVSTSQKRYNS